LEGKKRLSVDGSPNDVEPHKESYKKSHVSKFEIAENYNNNSNTMVGENK